MYCCSERLRAYCTSLTTLLKALQQLSYRDVFLGESLFHLVLEYGLGFSGRSYNCVRNCKDLSY